MSLRPTLLWVVMAVLVGVAGRLLPHPPNISPILALSLVSGMAIRSRLAAATIPVTALVISDLALGLYDLRIMLAVYGGLTLPVLAGPFLRRSMVIPKLAACSLAGSCLFFVISNLAVFAFSGAWPLTLAGALACYAAALPFFVNSIVGDLVWCFGLLALLYLARTGQAANTSTR